MTEAEVRALEELAYRFKSIRDRSPDAVVYQMTFTAVDLRLLELLTEAEAEKQRRTT